MLGVEPAASKMQDANEQPSSKQNEIRVMRAAEQARTSLERSTEQGAEVQAATVLSIRGAFYVLVFRHELGGQLSRRQSVGIFRR